MKRRSLVSIGVVLSLLTFVGAAPLLAADTGGGETPAKLVDRMKAAGESGDLAEMVSCIAPDDRPVFSMMMVAATGMMVAFADMGTSMAEGMQEAFEGDDEPKPEAKPDPEVAKAKAKAAEMKAGYEALLGKHGLGDMMKDDAAMDEAATKKLLAGVDHAALIKDLMAFLDKYGDKKEGEPAEKKEGPIDTAELDVSKLKVEGDRAWIEGSKDMKFVKVDGRWYVELPKDQMGPGPS